MRLFVSVSVLIFISFVLLFSLLGYGSNLPTNASNEVFQEESYKSFVHKNDTGGWYFSIESNQKTLIVQKDIPAIMGNIAFADSIQALRVAKLMVYKLEEGIFPPSILISELDSLKIIY